MRKTNNNHSWDIILPYYSPQKVSSQGWWLSSKSGRAIEAWPSGLSMGNFEIGEKEWFHLQWKAYISKCLTERESEQQQSLFILQISNYKNVEFWGLLIGKEFCQNPQLRWSKSPLNRKPWEVRLKQKILGESVPIICWELETRSFSYGLVT